MVVDSKIDLPLGMDLNASIQIPLKSCRGFRLPEPIRRADHLSRKQIKTTKTQRAQK